MSAAAVRPITGRHVLIAVVAFFAVVIGVDAVFVTLAYRSFSGEVASNPYEAGIAFNRTLEQRRREAVLGWSAQAGAESGEVVAVRVLDRSGAPIPALKLTGSLERPATEAGRQVLNFKPAGDGWYRSEARLDGAWDLRAVARGADGAVFEIERRLVRP